MNLTGNLIGGEIQVLRGHADFETALEVDDYPYGFRLRTKIRYWVERAGKGSKEGQYRFVSCTWNPKSNHWNKPKMGTYFDWMWLYRDARDGHIHAWGLSAYDLVKEVAKVKAVGLWDQLNDAERDLLERCEAHTRLRTGDYYREWDELVASVRGAAKLLGYESDLYHRWGFDRSVEDGGVGKAYEPGFRLALSLVRAEDCQEYTLPELDKLN
jgi:hypothetical protein